MARRPSGIMKLAEMPTIMCQYRSTVWVRDRQNVFVCDPQASQAGLGYREHVVPEMA